MPERPSLLKLLANRRNARKCTGPKTVAGKERSSRNALRHGFYAHDLILAGGRQAESCAEYEELARAFHQTLQPRDPYEAALVDRIVSAEWQMRRALRFEAAIAPLSLGSKIGRGGTGVGGEARSCEPKTARSCESKARSCEPKTARSCENPLSHTIQRESLPVPAATGGSAEGQSDDHRDNDLFLLIRYESRADREFHRALEALRCYRARMHGRSRGVRNVPPPGRTDSAAHEERACPLTAAGVHQP